MRRRIWFMDGARLAPAFAAIRAEERAPETFPAAVLAEAEAAARSPRLPDPDLTHLPFVTLDPPGAAARRSSKRAAAPVGSRSGCWSACPTAA